MRHRITAWVLAGLAGLLVLVVGGGYVVFGALGATEREDFDPDRGRAALDLDRDPQTDDPAAEVEPDPGPDLPDDQPDLDWRRPGFESFLVLGSDARPGEPGRADVILVGLVPDDGSAPILFSLPRDLWIDNPCTGGRSRINAGLAGCGPQVSGPELMAIMVQDFTSIAIDHYLRVDFDGFTEVIDALGGIEICNEHRVRDERAELELPSGCVTAGGEDTLAWVRSRSTQEYVDGRWRTKPDMDDLRRIQRQQEVMLQALERVGDLGSLGQVRALAAGVAGSMKVSDSLSLARAAGLTWSLRDVESDDVRRVSLPVREHVTSGGAEVLLPVEDFSATLGRELPDGDEVLADR